MLGKAKAAPGPKTAKPIKPWVYYALSAGIALGVSGALAFFLVQPQWRMTFSYQYNLIPASESHKPVDSVLEAGINPVMTQVEILKSDRFLDDIASNLVAQGHPGWTPERVAQSVRVVNPSQSNLIQVEVKTAQREVTQTIATQLDKLYRDYVTEVQKSMLEAERLFVESSLKNVNQRLTDGELNLHETIAATDDQAKASAFTLDPVWGHKALTQAYEDITRRMQEVENQIALEGTTFSHYKALLNKDEKTLLEGVILGEDPVLQKITDQLANVETDANILSVTYTPGDAEPGDMAAKMKTLQKLYETHRQKILGGGGKPVIRDSVRKNLVEDMITSKIKLDSSVKLYQTLSKQRENVLTRLDQVSVTVGDYQAWSLQKGMLQNTRAALQKRLDDINYQIKNLVVPVKLFRPIPLEPAPVNNMPHTMTLFFSSFSGLFVLLAAVPLVMDYRKSLIPTRSVLGILKELLQVKGQQIILMMPVYSSGHLNAAAHLAGLLNQFGRDALVIDVDLNHRLLSRKIPLEHPYGVFEHMLNAEMKKPYLDPLSGARILPLEATLEADKVVEYSQIVQRMPRVWSRWSGSIIILDLSQWHEAYHQLLPHVSQVIFYVPPSHQSSILLPKVFKGKYNVPVSLVEIQPEV